jgi:hypothetical protein
MALTAATITAPIATGTCSETTVASDKHNTLSQPPAVHRLPYLGHGHSVARLQAHDEATRQPHPNTSYTPRLSVLLTLSDAKRQSRSSSVMRTALGRIVLSQYLAPSGRDHARTCGDQRWHAACAEVPIGAAPALEVVQGEIHRSACRRRTPTYAGHPLGLPVEESLPCRPAPAPGLTTGRWPATVARPRCLGSRVRSGCSCQTKSPVVAIGERPCVLHFGDLMSCRSWWPARSCWTAARSPAVPEREYDRPITSKSTPADRLSKN